MAGCPCRRESHGQCKFVELCCEYKQSGILHTGVVAVAVYGLYGAATSKWDMSAKVEESGVFDAFWDTLSFVVNGIVFFFSGVACINFFVRYHT